MGVEMFGAFIAARAKEPRLKLDANECHGIARGVEHVASYHNIPMSPYAQAWIGLVGVIGAAYYGKIIAIRFENAMKADDRPPVASHVEG